MKSTRGLTLMEILVAIGIFALVMAALASVLNITGRFAQTSRARQGSFQGLVSAAGLMKRELREAPPNGVGGFYPSGAPTQGDLVLYFVTARDQNGVLQETADLEPIYQGWRIYYHHQNRLHRAFLPITPSTTFAAPSPANISGALNPASDRRLASHLDRFLLLSETGLETDQPGNPVRLRMEIGTTQRGQEVPLGLTLSVRCYP